MLSLSLQQWRLARTGRPAQTFPECVLLHSTCCVFRFRAVVSFPTQPSHDLHYCHAVCSRAAHISTKCGLCDVVYLTHCPRYLLAANLSLLSETETFSTKNVTLQIWHSIQQALTLCCILLNNNYIKIKQIQLYKIFQVIIIISIGN
jgi:hypothetical protein